MIFARPNSTLFAFALLLSLAACGENPHLTFELEGCNVACEPGYVCQAVLGNPVCVPEAKDTDGGAIDASTGSDADVIARDGGLELDAAPPDASDGASADAASIDGSTLADAAADATIADAALDAAPVDAGAATDAAADSGGSVDCEDDIHAWSNADLDPYRGCTVIGSLTIYDDGTRTLTINDVSMPALQQVRRDVVIANTTNVTEVDWPLVTKTGKIAIMANEGVSEIAFDELSSTDLFFITDNEALETIALPALDSATLLHVQNNPLIESLGAPLLRSASLKVHDSPALTNITFPALQIAGFIWITSGPRSNLDLLRTIDLRLLDVVTFERSPSASDYIFPEVDPAVGVHNVYGSAGVPYGEGAAALWLAQLPALESVRLDALTNVENRLELVQTGEASADGFLFDVRTLEHAGHISIANNAHLEAINLAGLIDVTPHASSALRASLLIESNPRLVSVALDALETVREELAFSQNGGPDTPHVALEAPSLEWVRRLVLSTNPSLTEVSFPSLTQIGDISPTPSGLLVQNNAKLTSLDFGVLATVSYGDIDFNNNDALEVIDLSNMTSFTYGSFYARYNGALHTIDLESLATITTFGSYVLLATDNPMLCVVLYSFSPLPSNWTIAYGSLCG